MPDNQTRTPAPASPDELVHYDKLIEKSKEDLETFIEKAKKDLERAIEEAIERHKKLEYKRNMQVTICCFPNEILGRIFMFSTNHDSAQPLTDRKFPEVMHVCRFWRDVAKNTSSMWKTPDFTRPNLALEVMSYSKSAPLNVVWTSDLGIPQQRHLDALSKALTKHAKRISSLELCCPSDQLTNLLSKMSGSAPKMHSLSIEARGGGPSFVLPNNFLANNAPRLTSFSSRGLNFPWGSPILGHITALSIGSSNGASSLAEVAMTLRRMRALEVLILSDFLPAHCDNAIANNVVVDLPHLQRIELSSRGLTIITLLSHMSVPAATTIDITVTQLRGDDQESLANCLSTLFLDASRTTDHPRTIRSLRVVRDPGSHFVLSTWNIGLEDDSRPGWLAIPQTRCRIEEDEGALRERIPDLRTFLDSLGRLAALEALKVGSALLSDDILTDYFGNLPALKYICAVNDPNCALDLVRSLSPSLSTASLTRPMLYPALATIGLTDVDFGRLSLLQPLIEALRLRASGECGTPVKKVVSKGCRNLRFKDVKLIRDQVDEVVWDRFETDAFVTDVEDESVVDRSEVSGEHDHFLGFLNDIDRFNMDWDSGDLEFLD